MAARINNVEMIHLLLDTSINVNSTSSTNPKKTALHEASLWGALDSVQTLIDHGSDLHVRDGRSSTVLHLAVQNGHNTIVEMLLSLGIDINAQDIKGKTALHLAVQIRNQSLVEILLRHGADIKIKDYAGYAVVDIQGGKEIIIDNYGNMEGFEHVLLSYYEYCLYDACITSNENLFHEFLTKLSIDELNSTLTKPTSFGHLWYAAKNGNLEIFSSLMENYPDLILKPELDGTTPYLMALIKNHKHILNYLKEKHVHNPYEDPTIGDNNDTIVGKADSYATLLTFKHPVFNDDIEGNPELKILTYIDDFSRYTLFDLCSLNDAKEEVGKSEDKIMYVGDIEKFGDCYRQCRHKIDCLMVEDMIKVVQQIEKRFREKAPKLKSKFILVGSIAEGTRIGSANELDITWKFNGLNKFPLYVSNDGYSLTVSQEGGEVNEEHPLFPYCDGNALNFQYFFAFLLCILQDIIDELKGDGH